MPNIRELAEGVWFRSTELDLIGQVHKQLPRQTIARLRWPSGVWSLRQPLPVDLEVERADAPPDAPDPRPRRRRKLSDREVQTIGRLYTRHDRTQAELAARYGVSRTTIHNIVHGKRWRQLQGPHAGSESPAIRSDPAELPRFDPQIRWCGRCCKETVAYHHRVAFRCRDCGRATTRLNHAHPYARIFRELGEAVIALQGAELRCACVERAEALIRSVLRDLLPQLKDRPKPPPRRKQR